MNQFFYTACRPGRSVDGNDGFNVRAVTAGVDPTRWRALEPYARYAPPPMLLHDAARVTPATRRLALIDAPRLGRLLCQSVYLSVDRANNFFSHLLFDLPPGFDARRAVMSWASPFWREADGDFDAELPAVGRDAPAPGSLDDDGWTRALADPTLKAMFRFTLAAWLTRVEGRRLYLGARADEVAWCVYGLTRVLPPSFWANLTFSTYEPDPLRSYAALVGSWWGGPDEGDLPALCYSSGLGHNSLTGRASALPATIAYVDDAVEWVARGELARVDDVLDVARELGVSDAASLGRAHLFAIDPRELPEPEVAALLDRPGRVAWAAGRGEVALRWLAEWAMADPLRAEPLFRRAFLDGDVPPEADAGRLARLFAAEGAKALGRGEFKAADALFDRLVGPTATAAGLDPVALMLDSVDDPAALPWEAVARTLDRFGDHQRATAWLRVSPRRLARLLDLPRLAVAPKAEAVRRALGPEARLTDEVALVLADRPELAGAILDRLDRDGVRISSLDSLLSGDEPSRLLAGVLVGRRRSSDLVDRIVSAALAVRPDSAVSLAGVEPDPAMLIDALSPINRRALLIALLGRPVGEFRSRPGASRFLDHRMIIEESEFFGLNSHRAALAEVVGFVLAPSLTQHAIAAAVESLDHLAPGRRTEAREALIDATGITLISGSRRALRWLPNDLAPAFHGGPDAALDALFVACTKTVGFRENPAWLVAFLFAAYHGRGIQAGRSRLAARIAEEGYPPQLLHEIASLNEPERTRIKADLLATMTEDRADGNRFTRALRRITGWGRDRPRDVADPGATSFPPADERLRPSPENDADPPEKG